MGFFALAVAVLAGPRAARWKEVDAAVSKGLPKTAIEQLEPIIAGALADKAYPEAIRAIGRRVALETEIQGRKPEEAITRLQAEIEKAPAAMKPAMEAILAHWYWQYFQQNRWKFQQRTNLASGPGADLLTWDLAHIIAAIDRHFSAALADAAALQATPVADYDFLLSKGNMPDRFRPSLWDFLVYDALEFYQAGEQLLAEDEFEVTDDSPIFADVALFMKWRPETTETISPKLKAIRLYQALLRFHQDDKDRSAFHDADLARLTYGFNVAVGDAKEERYRAALQHFITATARYEVSARADAALAERLLAGGQPAMARIVAKQGLASYPNSAGGAMCFNLINLIEAKSAFLQTELVWNAPWPTLNVTYQNVTKVYFRAVAVDFNKYMAHTRWRFGQVDDQQREEIRKAKPVLEWSASLPATDDFKSRTERLAAPTSLKPGFYVILASFDRSFRDADNQVSGAAVWISDLALAVRRLANSPALDGFVLRAGSGEPVADATVRVWSANNGMFSQIASTKTDRDGRFRVSGKDREILIQADDGQQSVASGQGIYSYYYGNAAADKTDTKTVFFTDRAIYRPGQTINYKGVSIRYNPTAARYSALDRLKLTVVFLDPNGNEIARAEHQTNDYGSFAGTFTAPRDRMLGLMTIKVLDRPSMNSFRVEEYKRPKFQVKVNAPAEAPKLGASVVLTGNATAYTGAAIGGAKVKWRVERSTRCPFWCWWWQPTAPKAIAHGTAVTDADGTFKVEFPAAPDRTVPEKNEPVFSYTVHADVTDTTGETRSDSRTVQAGYTALQATVAVAPWQTPEKPVEFTLATQSLDGEPQPAEGTLTVSALQQPAAVERAPLEGMGSAWFDEQEPREDPANPNSWTLADRVMKQHFKTDPKGEAKAAVTLQPGVYRAALETKDRFGKTVTARCTVEVVDPRAAHYGVKVPEHFSAPKWTAEPGETFTALWGTGYDRGRAFVELEVNGRVLKSYWTSPGRTQELVQQPVTEDLRGGFTLRVTFVRENRAYFNQQVVDVPWSNQQLAVKWEHFRSKLMPGQGEKWTAVVTGPGAKPAAAEMVAALYDASLDQFTPHSWPEGFDVFRREEPGLLGEFLNIPDRFENVSNWDSPTYRDASWMYRAFPPEVLESGGEEIVTMSKFQVSTEAGKALPAAAALRRPDPSSTVLGPASGGRMAMAIEIKSSEFLTDSNGQSLTDILRYSSSGSGENSFAMSQPGSSKPDLSKIIARKNLNETAFFFPQLLAGDDGVVRMEFTMPEALTEWKFLGFAHDKQLRAGLLTGKAVTAKDLMVEPNPPRFVREGDALEFTVKVSNRTDQPQSGTVRLTFADAATLKSVDNALGNHTAEQAFEIPAKQSRSYAWRIAVPDGMGFLTYKAVGASAQASDGEEGFLPVLSRRILVTESLPVSVRGQATKEYAFQKLLDSGASDTLRSQSLTVQMVSQPAWYAVMALPYLMEFPYECSEQVFNRFYANALARRLANSDPKIRRVFDLWKGTASLDSPLTKNQDLKSVMLEETPWVREAAAESQSRRNVGLLFDANRLDEESARVLHQLSERQLDGGLWTWFPGGRPSEYISLYIMTGFGRLRQLGVDADMAPALKSLGGLDAWMAERHREILKWKHSEEYVPDPTVALYLYGRSFFLKDRPVANEHQEAVDFFLRQSRALWTKVADRQSQAHLALALQRFGDGETPAAIVRSLKERSVSSDEMGMFWRDTEGGWWWYHAPIETQAMMIEAFDEIAHDTAAVEACKVWLLRQKQTQDWGNTKATADAIYGLLLHGSNLLASDALVEVSLGGVKIKPEQVEAGTGFYEQKFIRQEITPAQGRITVKKTDEGISWGSVHWQYLEDMAKVTPHEGTPLLLKKALFTKETGKKGQVLKPVTGPLAVGDELVVRLELRTDRDMEFVHLKDQRGSGTEPVNVLSGYKYQDGLGYYESTRDTASHFFIEYLPKGTYVFEYSTRVQLKGSYQTGIAEIQCMYAPEFNSHSESFTLEVR